MADVELIALCIAARRRGLTYGQLVAQTTGGAPEDRGQVPARPQKEGK